MRCRGIGLTTACGLRTTKTVGTSRVDYYRAGGLLLGEVHTDGDESYTITHMYDESGRMLGFRLDGAEYYYVRDYSGDVTGLINSRGELIGSYLYDPWGVLLETYLNTFEEETAEWTDADRAEYMRVLNLNPIRYKSYYYDTETGFYYLQSRYYDPITTRFINADGLISTGTGVLGYNMFAYCNNNPIMYSDSTGMSMVLDNKGLFVGPCGGGFSGQMFVTTSICVGIVGAATAMASKSAKSLSDSKSQKLREKRNSEKNYMVYKLVDEDNKVKYVGRTKNEERRKIAHANDPFRSELKFEPVERNLTYEEARGMEQILILEYNTINTLNRMNNQINGISPRNKRWMIYIEVGKGVLGYMGNRISDDVLDIIGY